MCAVNDIPISRSKSDQFSLNYHRTELSLSITSNHLPNVIHLLSVTGNADRHIKKDFNTIEMYLVILHDYL